MDTVYISGSEPVVCGPPGVRETSSGGTENILFEILKY
jgi:hypothetical protein